MCAKPWELLPYIRAFEEAQVGAVHFDVMDRHFVPNIMLGAAEFDAIRSATDLPLDVQSPLLALTDATRRLGVTLSESNLMNPLKSVTAVMGVFRDPHRSSHPNCADCLCHDFCTIRTSGRTCRG